MTVQDIIKVLPMDNDLRMKILDNFDSMKPSKKFMITKAAWKTYMMIYEEKLDQNLELQFYEVSEGKGKLGKDFYARALKKTEHQMTKDLSKSIEAIDLAVARKTMEFIVREIEASKKAPKSKIKY